ncbi:unnamed protein product [Meloidogyne enterolobii]|uniref:Uncharacterized protein n=1 Tax=Meloidogyne enterolobii TaxID=390850 RepID=A0ACB0XXG8_MELEN
MLSSFWFYQTPTTPRRFFSREEKREREEVGKEREEEYDARDINFSLSSYRYRLVSFYRTNSR